MRLLLNLIWLVFGGLLLALGYAVAALVMFILIITIPFGVAAGRMAMFCVWPFGRTLVRRLRLPPAPLPHRPRHEEDGWQLRGRGDAAVDSLLGPYVLSGGWWRGGARRGPARSPWPWSFRSRCTTTSCGTGWRARASIRTATCG